jgi:hypothetical protein
VKASTYKLGGHRRSDSGASTVVRAGLYLNPTLLKIASEPTAKPKVKTAKKQHHRAFLTDDQVRAARYRYEVEFADPKDLAVEFNMTMAYTQALLNYDVRTNVM